MKKTILQSIFVWCAILVVPICALAFTAPGTPTGYVNDYTTTLSSEEKMALETKLQAFNASTSNEVSVVIIESLNGDYIEYYAYQLFQAWKIGSEKNDNGVLLLVAMADREMRIEVGYGLEGALTDAIAHSIIQNDLTPAFKQENYYIGISNALDAIIAVTSGEYVGAQTSRQNLSFDAIEAVIFALIFVFQFLAAILGRSKSWWFGGVLGAGIGGFMTYLGVFGVSVIFGGIVTLLLVLLGLIFDYIVSTGYTKAVASGSAIPWWAGGSHGGGGGGGSSFGGFGGGSSGGGGASGRW